jgi:YD repeat-containing protein
MLNRYLKAAQSLPVSFFLLLIAVMGANAQNQPAIRIQSPNVSTFEKFKEVPVDLFTGTPNISAPLHTLDYGTIKVPIELRYHPSSVLAAAHPGWVGQGWDLSAGGAITRTIRGGVDEFYVPGAGGFNAYYPSPSTPASSGSGGAEVDVSDWNTSNRLAYYFQVQMPAGVSTDVQADEFSFNFLGHSGKFYYEGSQGWKVISDENVSVQLNAAPNDFLSAADVNNDIQQYTGKVEQNFNNTLNQTRAFNSFTLTTADGTRYVFGGSNAIEFYSSFTPDLNGPQFIATAWYLAKIIDPDNNEVDFTYRRDYPSCELFCGKAAFDYGCNVTGGVNLFGPGGSALASETGSISTSTYSGVFHWPMFLSKIASPNETVSFSSSVATCLRFSDIQFLSLGSTAVAQFAKAIVNNDLNNLQWEKLDNITVTNLRGRIYHQYQFAYNNVSTQRLALNSVTEMDNANTAIGQYQFAYNNIAGLPLYDGNHSDHWGFYNGMANDVNGVDIHNVASKRQTDNTAVTTGLLTKMTYPTGGYTQFSWEAHDYSQYVSIDRASLLSAPGTPYAGGSRITDISSYLADGSLAYQKKYIYKRGYTSGANIASLASSGILNGQPQYVFDIQQRATLQGDVQFSLHEEYFNPYVSYSYNGLSSYIGYDEVVQLNRDGSYTKNNFTSYGPDYNGVSHFDQIPYGYIGWLPATDNNVPHTDLDRERGKLVAALDYTPGNILVKKTINTYRSDAARFDQYLKHVELSVAKTETLCRSEGLILATANKLYSYMYYPVTNAVTTYDPQGNNPVTVTTSFGYNSNNLISSKSFTNSKNEGGVGETVVQNTSYTTEAGDNISTQMVSAHMLNYITAQSTSKNGLLQQLNKTLYYSPSTGLYKPQVTQQQNGGNVLETREQFYQYDAHGNVLERSHSTDVHEVYLWSYNFRYPVAKIVGSTYSAVSGLLSQSQIDAANGSDAAMRAVFATLRTQLPGVFISSYTYSPVYGMTSMTDPQGRNTYYDYDGFGRLVAMRDQDNNVIKRHCYNYAGQSISCALFYNAVYSLAKTRNCDPAYQGTSVTYTVPAQIYAGTTQANADQMAINDANANAQAYADANGSCQLLYWNDPQQGTYTKNNCSSNQVGTSYTTVVPAHTYSSTASVQAANQLALDYIAANGQTNANQNGQCNCISTTVTLSNNGGATGYRAIITNSTTGASVTYNFPGSGSTTLTATFAPGTYSIGFAPTGGPGTNHTYTYAMGPNGGSASGTSALFSNINIAAVPCILNLNIF